MLSAIQVQRLAFSCVDIQILQPDPGQDFTEKYASKIGMSDLIHLKDEDLWNLSLDVQFGPETGTPARYKGHLTVHGTFKVHPEFPPEKIKAFVQMNGVSLLLGSVREMVTLITSRCVLGELVLATFDAQAFIEPPVPRPSPARRRKK